MISDNTQLNAVLMTALQVLIASCEWYIKICFINTKRTHNKKNIENYVCGSDSARARAIATYS